MMGDDQTANGNHEIDPASQLPKGFGGFEFTPDLSSDAHSSETTGPLEYWGNKVSHFYMIKCRFN